MRSLVSSNRLRCLSQVAVISLLAGITAGCSSDFTRFDRNLYSALPQSANQQVANQQNPYPEGVDATTTASIRSGGPVPLPVGDVDVPRVQSDDGNYRPQIDQNPYPGNSFRGAQPLGTPAGYSTPDSARSGIVRKPLPLPVATNPASSAIDPVNTASVAKTVAPVQNVAAASPQTGVAGWNSAGGTQITLRSGETLYNISKRYGVPVSAIMKANNLTNPATVQAGQSILIPTYVYSNAAPVSAPDNDPNTRAAKASTGMMGQADPDSVITPTPRPQQTAALRQPPLEEDGATLGSRYKPKPQAKEETNEKVPDYSIVTGSVAKPAGLSGGSYTVQPGDTLSRIASQHGVSTADLMQANSLSSSTIRIGQTLVIPGASTTYGPKLASAPANVTAPGVDPIVTGSTAKAPAPKTYVKPTVDQTVTNSVDTKTPERTGIDQFRWPVQGRIVSGFGETRNGSRNDGIDISVPEGTAVKAAENGVVIYSGNELEEFGNLILLRHTDGYVTAYAHNKSNSVAKGANVRRGDVIALSGRTGKATAPVLHFEVRKDSQPVNPVKYLGG